MRRITIQTMKCLFQLMALRLKLQWCSLKKYRKPTQCIECYTFSTVESGKLAGTAKLSLFQCLGYLFISDEARLFIKLYSPYWHSRLYSNFEAMATFAINKKLQTLRIWLLLQILVQPGQIFSHLYRNAPRSETTWNVIKIAKHRKHVQGPNPYSATNSFSSFLT